MNSNSPILFHVVDSTPGAYGRWMGRLRSVQGAKLRVWDAVPVRMPQHEPSVWVLVPDSFLSPFVQRDVMNLVADIAPLDSVVVVQNADMERPSTAERAMWMDSKESEQSFVRTFDLLARLAQERMALRAALQFPVDNPNPVLQFSADGTLNYANPAAEQLTNSAADEGVAMIDRIASWIQGGLDGVQVMEVGERCFGFRLEMTDPTGTVRVYGIDLTRSQEAVKRTTQMEAESKNKDEFLATMSHELRTPLNGILSCTEAMREGAYGYLDPEQMEAVSTIRESGKHLLCLINDILDISKMAAGRLELATSTLGVDAVAESVVEILKGSASAKDVSISLRNETSFSTIKGDPLRIKQILLNLLGNAIKFSPEGSEVGLIVRDAEVSGNLEFQVWDSGPGVSSDFADAIFKPFVQAEGSYSRSTPGTGLGLAIARDLARLHDGDLVLEAFDKPGAVFTVTLPAEEGDPEAVFDFRATGAWEVGLEADLDCEPEFDDSVERVLIAEDTDSNFQHVHDLLVSMGYSVDRACNGLEAVELAQEISPDLVLMDIDMPVMNGLDAIRLLREDPKTEGLPIIAVTAMAGVADELACMSAGANGFLAKPYPLRDLMTMMQSVGRQADFDPGRSVYSSTV